MAKFDENRMPVPWTASQRNSGIHSPYMHLSDMMLLLAEVYAELGEDGSARGLLKQVRERAFANAADADVDGFVTKCGSLKNAILEERKFELGGEGYRRIVAAPKPVAIVEIDAIRALADADQPVIAAGGGGIPVMEQGSHLKGASAVIEKDRAAGLLAKELDADVLMFITGVPNVVLNYGSDHPINIDKMTTADAARYAGEGHFKTGSMLPKVESSIDFINAGKGRRAIITSLDGAKSALAGKGGTTIQ